VHDPVTPAANDPEAVRQSAARSSAGRARLAYEMDIAHKDPFDRSLITQALAKDMVLVSNEALFDGFAAQQLW